MTLWKTKHLRILSGICVAWTGLILWLHLRQPGYQSVEVLARDWLATNPLAHRSPRHPQLVFLAIDEASKNLSSVFPEDIPKSRALQLMQTGFPWNREVYALAIDRLLKAGARAVVLDMLFPGPRDGDAEFRVALDKYRDHIVIGSNLQDVADDANSGETTINKKPTHIVAARTLMAPGPPYDTRLGFVNVYPDGDNKVRRTHYRTTLLEFFGKPPERGDEELLSLAARGLEKSGNAAHIPQTHEPVMFRFCREIRPHSLHEIFVETQWARPPYSNGEFFRDKLVIIGAAGNQAEDRLQTPFGTTLGPMIHLSAMNAALNNDFLHETSRQENIAIIVAGGLLAWLLGGIIQKPIQRALLLLCGIVGIYALVQTLFNVAGVFPILLSPLLALGGAGYTWSAWEQYYDWREKQRMRKTFERYVSRDVVKELLDNPEGWLKTLGGQRKKITVLFSDLRGFTALTERADPHALVAQLNEYFNDMVGVVFANQGTLDKFIGDAVMAHWGSIKTEGLQADARRAVATAVEMRRSLVRLNEKWKARGIPPLVMGIGVNNGEAIVGNIGCEAKMEFSMIGDAVNLASRLEGVTRNYDIDLCIGESVAPLVRDIFILRSLDLIIVKGKTQPVAIFTVLGERESNGSEPAWLARHEEAVQRYRAGDFNAAEEAWREVLVQCPGDPVAEVFLQRCAELRKSALPADWRGVFEMTHK
jgi:adenylate cyclase